MHGLLLERAVPHQTRMPAVAAAHNQFRILIFETGSRKKSTCELLDELWGNTSTADDELRWKEDNADEEILPPELDA